MLSALLAGVRAGGAASMGTGLF
uniref:Uncharacterized protein n=1 Tax=Arundo donax TaxID=35708 RepID=A0A0A9FIS1_ARUDO